MPSMPVWRYCAVVGRGGREHDASPLVSAPLLHLHSLFASQVDAILRLNAAFIQKYGLDTPQESEWCRLDVSMCSHFWVIWLKNKNNLMFLDISRAVLLLKSSSINLTHIYFPPL